MVEPDRDAFEQVWAWLAEALHSRGPDFQFNAQSIDGHVLPDTEDALWRLASAQVIRLGHQNTQYVLTEFGVHALQDMNPEQSDSRYVGALEEYAPLLDPSALGYVKLALGCLPDRRQAAVALVRVAVELEVRTTLLEIVESLNSPSRGDQHVLRRGELAAMSGALVRLARDRGLLAAGDDVKDLESGIERVRISGNEILHPSSGIALVDSWGAHAVFHSFQRFASLASRVKKTLRGAGPT